MKIRNSTDWEDHFLRRMTAWCVRSLDMRARDVRLAVFRNSRSAWGGCARYWSGQITVCVGRACEFPATCSTHAEGESFADRIECLVAITAHELYHIAAHRDDEHRQRTRGHGRGHGSSERVTCAEEMRVLALFRDERETLLAEWSVAALARPKPSAQEARAKKAQDALDAWSRRLKLAQTKCKKYRQRVAYYDRKAACKPQ